MRKLRIMAMLLLFGDSGQLQRNGDVFISVDPWRVGPFCQTRESGPKLRLIDYHFCEYTVRTVRHELNLFERLDHVNRSCTVQSTALSIQPMVR